MAKLTYLPGEMLFWHACPAWKRPMDIVGGLAGIILTAPIMLIVAAAIKLTSPGPVIFRQERAGQGGAPFICYKFRSMEIDAEGRKNEMLKFNERNGPAFKMARDPRVTRVGRVIRKWSLDELPQFFNVLLGDMSLVGPRPPTMDEVPKYSKWQNRRLEVKPGITCLWQIYARHDSCFDRWVRLDIDYVKRQSFWLDVKILLLTIPAVLFRRGAH